MLGKIKLETKNIYIFYGAFLMYFTNIFRRIHWFNKPFFLIKVHFPKILILSNNAIIVFWVDAIKTKPRRIHTSDCIKEILMLAVNWFLFQVTPSTAKPLKKTYLASKFSSSQYKIRCTPYDHLHRLHLHVGSRNFPSQPLINRRKWVFVGTPSAQGNS